LTISVIKGLSVQPLAGSSPHNFGTSFCEGYMRGLSGANNVMGFCRRTAAERSPGFEREDIQRLLASHPARLLQEPAHQLVLVALRQEFPCL